MNANKAVFLLAALVLICFACGAFAQPAVDPLLAKLNALLADERQASLDRRIALPARKSQRARRSSGLCYPRSVAYQGSEWHLARKIFRSSPCCRASRRFSLHPRSARNLLSAKPPGGAQGYGLAISGKAS